MKNTIHKILLILFACFSIWSITGCNKDNSGLNDNIGNTGKGGSLARFIINGAYMYVVDNATLKTFSLSDPKNPSLVNSIQIGFNIETIYAFKDNLFIGSQDAMYIYNIQNPSQPTYKSTSSHLRACDPVVADDNYAYVTVRSSNNGSPCGGTANALMVYDVTNISYPVLINELQLSNPHGLGLKNNILYVCDDINGLRILDISDPKNIQFKYTIKNNYAYQDVIIDANYMYCMLTNGFIIYDISKPQELPVQVAQMIH